KLATQEGKDNTRHYQEFSLRDPPTTGTYPLSLHDALPISAAARASCRRVIPQILTRVLIGAVPIPRRTPRPPGKVLPARRSAPRSEEHTSELQSRGHLVCRLLLEKKKDRFTSHDASVMAVA